tara:strand:- start:195 stop:326 length:132 start_codon:yes stop_codon:yes gene_type:complete
MVERAGAAPLFRDLKDGGDDGPHRQLARPEVPIAGVLRMNRKF